MAQGYQQSQQWGNARGGGGGGGGGKGLPIAIGAGLAVGVFVGLIVIRGTGAEAEAETEPSADVDASAVATATPDAAPVTPDAAVVAAVDAAPPKPKAPVLTVAVLPEDAENVEITVDGAAISGKTYEVILPEGKTEKRVRVRVKAKGFRSFSRRVTVSADQTLDVTLKKRGRGGGNTGGNSTPGGLIDL